MNISKITSCYNISTSNKNQITFASKDFTYGDDLLNSIIETLELASKSRENELGNYHNIPEFFDIDLSNVLSDYETIKDLSTEFKNKLIRNERFKKAISIIKAGINGEYLDIASINYTLNPAQIPRAIKDNVLYNMLYCRTVKSKDETLPEIKIFSNREGSKKAYIKSLPNGSIFQIITSKVTRNGEEKECLYEFDKSGKLKLFEEVQEDSSIRRIEFSGNLVVAVEKDANNKTKTIRRFYWNK